MSLESSPWRPTQTLRTVLPYKEHHATPAIRPAHYTSRIALPHSLRNSASLHRIAWAEDLGGNGMEQSGILSRLIQGLSAQRWRIPPQLLQR